MPGDDFETIERACAAAFDDLNRQAAESAGAAAGEPEIGILTLDADINVRQLAIAVLRSLVIKDGRFDVPTELILYGAEQPGSVQGMFDDTIGNVLRRAGIGVPPSGAERPSKPEVEDFAATDIKPAPYGTGRNNDVLIDALCILAAHHINPIDMAAGGDDAELVRRSRETVLKYVAWHADDPGQREAPVPAPEETPFGIDIVRRHAAAGNAFAREILAKCDPARPMPMTSAIDNVSPHAIFIGRGNAARECAIAFHREEVIEDAKFSDWFGPGWPLGVHGYFYEIGDAKPIGDAEFQFCVTRVKAPRRPPPIYVMDGHILRVLDYGEGIGIFVRSDSALAKGLRDKVMARGKGFKIHCQDRPTLPPGIVYMISHEITDDAKPGEAGFMLRPIRTES